MIVKIYDEASSNIKVSIPVDVNRYMSTPALDRALCVCQVLLHLPDKVLPAALCGVFCFPFSRMRNQRLMPAVMRLRCVRVYI